MRVPDGQQQRRARSACHSGSECQVPKSGTLALSSVWHLALWHSAPFGTWHFGTQLRLALGTLALSSVGTLALAGARAFRDLDSRTSLLCNKHALERKLSPCTLV